ncbi:MAG: hypothetical protein ACYC1C_20865, partial [Chloroflexota bacterium]
AKQAGFERVSMLLASTGRTKVQDAALAGLQLAGRATVNARREEAFLQFVISLESLVVPTPAPEITYRLSRRLAHLLGENKDERKQIVDDLKKLYATRSRIAHSGYAEISNSDLMGARMLAKRTIYRLLNEEPFVSFNTLEDLESWCEDRLLG